MQTQERKGNYRRNYSKEDPRFGLALQQGFLLPFTVTKSVTNRELSIAVESRDVNLVFEQIS
jgi:hypothetical protein